MSLKQEEKELFVSGDPISASHTVIKTQGSKPNALKLCCIYYSISDSNARAFWLTVVELVSVLTDDEVKKILKNK